MQVLKGFEQFIQSISDAYCLLSLAIKSQFKTVSILDSASKVVEKERAKAVNAD